MLDVHPPHHPTHTWTDFFIHIATIVVGLLIAVGLEQTVEFVHHRHEIAETREALRAEREENYARMARYTGLWRNAAAASQGNMMLLEALEHHQPTPASPEHGLTWGLERMQFATAAWHTAQSSGVLMLLPPEEVRGNERIYGAMQDISNSNEEEWLALNDAQRYSFSGRDLSRLSPAQIEQEIDMMQKVMMKHYLLGNFMGYLHTYDPNFDPGPADAELAAFHQNAGR